MQISTTKRRWQEHPYVPPGTIAYSSTCFLPFCAHTNKRVHVHRSFHVQNMFRAYSLFRACSQDSTVAKAVELQLQSQVRAATFVVTALRPKGSEHTK